MCGIVGIVFDASRAPAADAFLGACEDMLETLAHRGPDERTVTDLGDCILGHTRLSIIDLVTGSQPVYNESRTVAAILNGEIYNYRELRSELEGRGHVLRTASDTEVLAHLYEECGEGLFERLNGMFALAIWDSRRQRLVAGRDRLGEKPLLHAEVGGAFVLASELKSLLAFPGLARDVDPDAVALYLSSMYVPAPRSILRSVEKLPPAHALVREGGKTRSFQYWKPRTEVDSRLSEEEMGERFRTLFARSVRQKMVADVPLGVFLSGGIDSSAVTAYMATQSAVPVKTFTVGFSEDVDERPWARLVADRYRTEHTEIVVQYDLPETVSKVLAYMDEPFGDSSVVPTHVVAREARAHVKVILTGDGGDELFAGYGSYIDQKYQRSGRITTKAYRTLHGIARRFRPAGLGDRLLLRHRTRHAFRHWHRVRSMFPDAEVARLSPAASVVPEAYYSDGIWLPLEQPDSLSAAFEYDINYYLPDDLLKKVDMAAMLAGVECRAPFLDHELVEFALSIPSHLKVRGDTTKSLLKRFLARDLPDAVLERPKVGFGAPVRAWLRGPLGPMVTDLLAPGSRTESWVDRETIRELKVRVQQHARPEDYEGPQRLWLLLALEIWLRTYASEAHGRSHLL